MNEKEQEMRMFALKMAMQYKGDSKWSMTAIMKWADFFYVYVKTGEYTIIESVSQPRT